MKRIFLFLIAELFCILQIFPQDKTGNFFDFCKEFVHFSVSPSFSFHYGNQDESVFVQTDSDENALLSYLEWNQMPLLFASASSELGIQNAYIQATFSIAFPSEAGLVLDSDWMNITSSDSSIRDLKTNYSESASVLDSEYYLKLQTGYRFPVADEFFLEPFVGFDYNYSSFYARGGTAWYGGTKAYNDESAVVKVFDGNVLRLQRNFLISWLGLRSQVCFKDKLRLSVAFAFSPFIYAQSLDSHLLRKMYYLDELSEFLSAVKIEGKAEYAFNPLHRIFLTISYEQSAEILGKTYSRSEDTNWKVSDSSAGASFWNFRISAGYTFVLGKD